MATERLVDAPLEILAVPVKFATIGRGFTVTVISVAEPAQLPLVVVGVTTYIIEPTVLLLGLVNV